MISPTCGFSLFFTSTTSRNTIYIFSNRGGIISWSVVIEHEVLSLLVSIFEWRIQAAATRYKLAGCHRSLGVVSKCSLLVKTLNRWLKSAFTSTYMSLIWLFTEMYLYDQIASFHKVLSHFNEAFGALASTRTESLQLIIQVTQMKIFGGSVPQGLREDSREPETCPNKPVPSLWARGQCSYHLPRGVRLMVGMDTRKNLEQLRCQ